MVESIDIRLEQADRVAAHWPRYSVTTDQEGTAPSPFDLFLASIGTCAGFYVSRFCRSRRIDPAGIRISERIVSDPGGHRVERVEIAIDLPPGFPERYREAVLRAAGQCAVKQHLERPPAVRIELATARPCVERGVAGSR
jgi:ribosomal protein S12 methylthiotransferase accessory factor